MKTEGDVIVVVGDGVVLLDVAGPVQVLHAAGYRVRLASPGGRAVVSDTGIPLGAELAVEDVPETAVDTVLVPGYPTVNGHRHPPELIAHVRRLGTGARRTTSACTGAYLLAEAGLLDGRRATTHWAECAKLARSFPRVRVQPDAIYVRDGPVITSAGVTAGIDLALALVEEDHGPQVARTAAKYLVVFLQRPGGQSQFSVRSTVPPPRSAGLRQVLDAVVADPGGSHTLAAMAERLAVSERHLTRLFRREVGSTPGQYVERVRLEAAQAMLESSDAGVDTIARMCGFGSDESMRRVFLRLLGAPPSAYRARFRTTTA
ncbi:GlxA family transcriptional regulator [Streptomyces smyrnaeus]|uniref:GlxA family transcriptional regulator n=1 Tax=Streptomyces smyrnaeus TaxID=1387713 RepID=A0ABS3XV91_9ACTN|nr:GlxA family transcriptional regulator [Streptomyces smyrnaeus]MBO8199231.1 GlxA family transcriptional regulator [Streptomyces smyrnaeus]